MAEEVAHSFLRRGLQEAESDSKSESNSKGVRDEVLTLVIMVVAILAFIWLCWRFWMCASQHNRQKPAERIFFNLSEDQRRAVLEIIFSETTRTITDEQEKELEQETDALDAGLPGLVSTGTEDSMQDMETCSPRSSENAADSGGLDSGGDIEQAPSLDDDAHEEVVSLPDKSEDDTEQAQTPDSTELDDGAGDDDCPVCLSGYEKGDVLLVSKHCTHSFHKDCILEWLEKSDDCPVCRTAMVTKKEVSQAASSLLGKTRMYRATNTYLSENLSHSNSAPTTVDGRTQPSPLSHTMRLIYSTRYT